MSTQKAKTSKETAELKLTSTNYSNPKEDSVPNLETSNSKESSTSSVKVKKSSNFLSALVKKARGKKSKQSSDELKNLHVSSQNLSSGSTLSIGPHPTEEVELSIQNYEKKFDESLEENLNKESNGSNHSIGSKNTATTNSIFKKLSSTKKTPLQDPIKNMKSENNQCMIFGDNLDEENLTTRSENQDSNGIISSFINFGKNSLSITLADGLQVVQDLSNNLRESECKIFELLGKYVKEPGFQKEILNLVSKHNKIQWEAERRSSALANDMWLHQIETGRAQEKLLHTTLNSLVKQNRELQMENENLLRKQEKMIKKMRVCPEHGYRGHDFETSQTDSLMRHNEKLQGKLGSAFKKIESLEAELNLFQKQNESLELQLRISASKIQNLKACLHRAKTEFELEETSLHFKMENQEQILKESVEAGDVVLEDLDGLKRQFKNMPFALNWSKLKVRGSCLTDLIYLCRSCINELSKELINVTNESMLKDKDMQFLKENNQKLQEHLQRSTTELDKFSKHFENNPFANEANNLSPEQKCRILENDVKIHDDKMENLRKEFEIDRKRLEQMVDEYKTYKDQVEEKEKMIEQTKLFMLNMTTENYSLKNRIEELKNVLKETGAEDVVNEFHQNLEELENVKLLYNQLVNEKQILHEEIKTLNAEIKTLQERRHEDRQNNQILKKEIEKLVDELKTFRQQHDNEHHTITTLQNERMKYLEEKNLLKSIIQHLKNELSRTRQLEESLTNVTKEASKLGMIAEYNKQQGEKLKTEITEKNRLITELKTNVQKLNEVQIQNAKEKMSLCYELSEACQLKEKISEVLDIEVKKNQKLDRSKHDVVKTASLHIQKFQEQQNRERTALQVALKQLKTLEEAKSNFEKEKGKFQMEIENLKQIILDQNKKLEETTQNLDLKNKELEYLKQRLEKSVFVENLLKEKLKKEVLKYDSAKREADRIINELTHEIKCAGKVCKELKDKTDNTVNENNNLQEQIQQLQDTEIGGLQTKIKTLEDCIIEKTVEIDTILVEKEKLLNDKENLVQEKEKLNKDVAYFNSLMEKVVTDFENSIKAQEEKEHIFQNEIKESRNIIQKLHEEVENLNQGNQEKEKKINDLSEIGHSQEFYEQKYLRIKNEIKELEEELIKSKRENDHLQDKLSDLEEDYEQRLSESKKLTSEKENLQNQMTIVIGQKEEDYSFYKKHIADLVRTKEESEQANHKEITNLKNQIAEMSQKLHNEKSAYDTLSEIHKEISTKFMKSIKELVDLKNTKQELARKSHEVCVENEKLSQDFTLFANENAVLRNRLEDKMQELQGVQNKHLALLEKCISLENQLQELNKQDHGEAGTNERLEEEVSCLIKNQEQNFQNIHDLKMKIQELQQQVTILELEKSEIAFKLQESEKLLQTEKNLSEQLNNTHKLLLAAVLEMKEAGKVDAMDCLHLLHMVRSRAPIGGSTEIKIDNLNSDTKKSKKATLLA